MSGTSKRNSGDYEYGYPQISPQNDPEYVPYPAYVLLPGSPRRARSRSCGICSACKLLSFAVLLVSLGMVGFALFPRKTDVDVKQITLENISLHVVDKTSLIPSVQLDVSLNLWLKITNPNFFGVVYDKVVVFISYRGDILGTVQGQGGEIPSRSVVSATVKLDLQGTQLVEHAGELIADVANREVPFETVTVFTGAVEMFIFRPKINVKVYCSMLADPLEREVVLNADCSLLPFDQTPP